MTVLHVRRPDGRIRCAGVGGCAPEGRCTGVPDRRPTWDVLQRQALVVPRRRWLLRRIECAEDARTHLGREPSMQHHRTVVVVPEGEAAILMLGIGPLGPLRALGPANPGARTVARRCRGSPGIPGSRTLRIRRAVRASASTLRSARRARCATATGASHAAPLRHLRCSMTQHISLYGPALDRKPSRCGPWFTFAGM